MPRVPWTLLLISFCASAIAAPGYPSEDLSDERDGSWRSSTAKPRAAAKQRQTKRQRRSTSKRARRKSGDQTPSPNPSAKTAPQKAPPPRRVPKLEPVAMGPEERRLTEALKLWVTEAGPFQNWRAELSNTGSSRIAVQNDLRLLWFSARVPGKKRDVECRLPEAMLPKSAADDRSTILEPGARLSFDFDPRFFCFSRTEQSTLVAGAQLQAHYGWPTLVKKAWRGGRLHAVRSQQKPPYVASELQGDAGSAVAETHAEHQGDGQAATPTERPPDGLREVSGNQLLLDSSYQAWASTRLKGDKAPARRNAMLLALTSGSDTYSARDVSVTAKLTNFTQFTQRVYYRRDRLSFTVHGPDGNVECDSGPDYRAPDPQSYTRLPPGSSTTLTLLLNEFCPQEAFRRPGYYLVTAAFHAGPSHPGEGGETAPQAFTGTAMTERARLIRIRGGAEPFINTVAQSPDSVPNTPPAGPPIQRE